MRSREPRPATVSIEPSAEVMEVVARLRHEGFLALIVGGGLRDSILGREIHDWDVATDATCDQVSSMFPKCIPTGIRYGTVTVRLRDRAIEVSAFKGNGILEDLSHRDFTIDALAYDPHNKRLIDPFGGLRDLRSKRIRAVEDPASRFQEDPLRIMRAIRLARELDFHIHPATWRAIREAAGLLARVAPERQRDELTRSLMTPIPSWALRRLERGGIFDVLLPELKGVDPPASWRRVRRQTSMRHLFRTVEFLPTRPLIRWVGLLHGVDAPTKRSLIRGEVHLPGHEEAAAQAAAQILRRFRFSRKEIRRVVHLIRHQNLLECSASSDGALRRLVLKVGPESIEDLLTLHRAHRLAVGGGEGDLLEVKALKARIRWLTEGEGENGWLRPALRGTDVMEILRMQPGPRVGEVMSELHHLITEDPSANRRESLIQWLLERYGGRVDRGWEDTAPGNRE